MNDTEPRYDNATNVPERFGPTVEDGVLYRELLAKLDNNEELKFDPARNAESVAMRLDDAIKGMPGRIGIFTSPEEESTGVIEESNALKLAQQRYVASVLGFTVGPNRLTKGAWAADVEYPDVSNLPELPRRSPDGVFRRPDGSPMPPLQVDAIFSAHFIANHPDKFKELDAFRKIFQKVREGALAGSVSIKLDTFADDKRGARSFIRQAARVMGFEVGEFKTDDDGNTARMAVTGARKGFEGIGRNSLFDTFA